MIDWIEEKFSSVLSVCFVLYVILIAIACGVYGFTIADFTGTLLGLLIGTVVGILSGIFTFGLCATIISIAQSNNFILEYLRDISKKNENKNTPDNDTAKNNSAVWVCTKCGWTNPAGTHLCEKCGN